MPWHGSLGIVHRVIQMVTVQDSPPEKAAEISLPVLLERVSVIRRHTVNSEVGVISGGSFI